MPPTRYGSSAVALLAIGFEDAARWQTDGRKLKAVGYKSARWRWLTASHGALYAFCSGNNVLYIGRTPKVLSKRIADYSKPDSLRLLDRKLQAGIRKLLGRGKDVRILVLPIHASPIRWMSYTINLAAGWEDFLLQRFKPQWNKSGKCWRTEAAANEQELSAVSLGRN